MALGQLVVRLGLDAAEFTSGMSKAEAQSAKLAKRMQADMDASAAAAKKFGAAMGVAAGAAVAGFAAMVKSQLDAVDAFNDLSDASGASVENISALDAVARRTGGSFETVETTVLKLNKALGDEDGKNGIAQALKALGLNADELRKADPADAVLQVAKALDGYDGNANKARLTTEIFGKSTKDVAAFLKDLAEQGQLVASVTGKQAEEVERFNKSLATLKATAEDLARTVGFSLVPALNNALKIFTELQKGPGVFAAIGEVFKGNTFTSAGEALTFYNSKVAELDKRIATIKSDRRPLIQANAAAEIASLEKQRAKLVQFGDAYRNILNDGSAGGGRGSAQIPGKPSLPDMRGGSGSKGGKSAAASFTDYASEIQQAVARMVDDSSIARIQRLNDQLKELDALQAAGLSPEFLSDARAKVTADLVETIISKTEEASDAFRRLELNANQATNNAMNADALQRFSEMAAQFKANIDALNDGNRALEEEIAIITGGEAARRQLVDERYKHAIAINEERLAKARAKPNNEAEIALIEEEILRLRERRALTNARNEASDAARRMADTQRIFEEVGNTLGNAFESAVLGGKNLKQILADVDRQLAQIALRELVTKPFQEWLRSTVSGSGSTGGASGGSGGGFDWTKVISAVGSWFGGFFATGGTLGAGKWGIAGERGPEVIRGPANVIPMNRAMSMAASGSAPRSQRPMNFNTYITVPGNTDRRTAGQIGAEVSRSVAIANRRFN